MINLSRNPREIIPNCFGDVEFKLPYGVVGIHDQSEFGSTGIAANYANYWMGVCYWTDALEKNDPKPFSYLNPVPMSYSAYREMHPECPITARNIYTIAAIDTMAGEASKFFSSGRARDPESVPYLRELYSKAQFLIFGPKATPLRNG